MCVDVTADGKYFLTTVTGAMHLYDAATLTELGAIDMAGRSQFVNHDKYIVCHRLKTRFYSVPDLQLVHEDTVDFGWTIHYSEMRNSIYTVCDYSLLYEYSLDSFEVVREWRPADRDGTPYAMACFDLSFDDRLLYLIGSCSRGNVYITYDLEGDTLINEHLLYNPLGDVELNPVGGEVWVSDPATINGFTPGTIYAFDGQTGKYIQGISLFGYLTEVHESWDAMSARAMQISPDGKQLYVVTGHEAREQGTVLRIDTKRRRIEKLLFPDFGVWPYELAVGPKP
jgi:DNA-binding beta-propeller fold protein YncE